ncbi:signal transducing adapter molecule 1 [Cydia amplana]|uniref:signal transducing adapter molecule 1 n=1 Tax=Cydia amplana TaxID=1869771 RepID=UPI002FE5B6B4
MGIFGNSSPFDQDVEKATNENNSSEDWALILEICDRAGAGATAARDCLRAVTRRLAHTDPHVQLKAATLLDACVSNCGRNFLLEVASRDFLHEFRRLLSRAQPPVARRLRGLLKKWAENEFRGDPQLDLVPSLYLKLRVEGHEFETAEPAAAPAQTAASAAAREHDDLARAIELSLRESGGGATGGGGGATGGGGGGGGALYPRVDEAAAPTPTPVPAAPAPRKVRALYDFEAAEDNELTFLAGEILWVTDASDPNWWKGSNERGEGLFPANFVSADLEPAPKAESRPGGKSVQFAASSGPIQEEEEEPGIDEAALDAALLALHEASPEAPAPGEEDLARHEARALRQAGVVDAALQRADARHARLTQLSAELVDALNLYHHLMREPLKPYNMPQPHVPGVPPGVQGTKHCITPHTQLSAELVDALNLYHHLMREPLKPYNMPQPHLPGVPPGVQGTKHCITPHTQLSAELVDALNLYHHLMREPLKPYNMPQPHLPGVPPGVQGTKHCITPHTQLSAELVDALNLYHHLMREPLKPYNMPQPHLPGVPPGVQGVPGPSLPPHLQQLHYFPPPGPQHPPGPPPQPRC